MIREAFFIHESEIIINLRQQITSWWTPTRLIVTSNDTGSWNLLATVKEAISIPKANTNTAEVITESSGANITSLLFALWLTAAHRSRPTICSVVSFNSFWFVNFHLTVQRICTRLLRGHWYLLQFYLRQLQCENFLRLCLIVSIALMRTECLAT